ncbi:uracil-DNA glycosylase [Marinicellulosiphila megalodicopiae]|uniref:uracil-DNA glycosylase n=1 Tax=Marinicellulosiphila megalodicopiae TaxID=2724896 RepID=UPI003BB16221
MSEFLKDLFPKLWMDQLGEQTVISILNPIEHFLNNQKNKTLFPERSKLFHALNLTDFENTKIVILGQDPYHGEGQAQGLAFSVPNAVKFPPSLKNIFKELESDLNVQIPLSGDLTAWANQGVLLLNTVLSVEKAKANSHKSIGWLALTDLIIKTISDKKQNVVFVLWGKPAQLKAQLIDESKHCIVQSVHPSPLSSYRGFFGSCPFSQSNKYLEKTNQRPVDWSLI